MDVDLASVVTAISKNKSIKHLNMGRNLNNMKAKHIALVMDAVVQMIQVSNIRLYLFRDSHAYDMKQFIAHYENES
jgi:hypothetical protein